MQSPTPLLRGLKEFRLDELCEHWANELDSSSPHKLANLILENAREGQLEYAPAAETGPSMYWTWGDEPLNQRQEPLNADALQLALDMNGIDVKDEETPFPQDFLFRFRITRAGVIRLCKKTRMKRPSFCRGRGLGALPKESATRESRRQSPKSEQLVPVIREIAIAEDTRNWTVRMWAEALSRRFGHVFGETIRNSRPLNAALRAANPPRLGPGGKSIGARPA